MAVQALWPPDLGDCGHRDAQDAHPAHSVVLGGLLVATHTPGISALQLQRQLGISRYETAWLILHKLRRAMVAPERQPLSGEVEIDETLVGGRREGHHVARRHGENALVGAIVEVRGTGSGRLRLGVLPHASQDTLTAWVRALVAPGAIVHTDGWPGYASSPAPATTTGRACSDAITPTPRSSCRAPTAPPRT